jgi:8-oxo-dGTP pyrophosphatase MutT (NUDIX family)
MQTVVIAKALLLDDAGNMLILRRSSTHPTLAHFPDLPGGLIEPDEKLTEGLLREIREETGLIVAEHEVRPIYAGTEVYGDESRVRILYAGRLPSGAKPHITVSQEHESAEWLPLSEIESIEQAHHSFYKDALHAIRTNDLLAGLEFGR